MRTKSIILFLATILFVACYGDGGNLKLESFSFSDSCEYATVDIQGEIPAGEDEVSQAIRDSLLEILETDLSYTKYDGVEAVERFTGDKSKMANVIGHYGPKLFEALYLMCKEDVDERNSNIDGLGLSEAETDKMKNDFSAWTFKYTLKMDTVTSDYAIFQLKNHTSVGNNISSDTGKGFIFFNMKTGKQVKHIVDPECNGLLQDIIKDGLEEYFKSQGKELSATDFDEKFETKHGLIPLPSEITISQEGIVFLYKTGEIASTDEGAPEFTVPLEDIKPYLTVEAKEMLCD